MDQLPAKPPPADSPEQRALDEAAKACGIETEYWDVFGKQHHASAQVEKAILKSLGVNGHGGPSVRKAVQQRTERDWLRPLPPTTVLLIDQLPHEVVLALPAWRAGLQTVVEIRFEAGEARQFPIALGDLPFFESCVLRGESYVRKRIPLPGDLPLGYHELSIQIPGLDSKPARLIVCPSRAYQPPWLEAGRAAGIAISLYGVRSHRNWGCGDTTDLKTVADWVAEEAQASFIGLNPLHSIPNRQPYNTSPYLPTSIFYRNPLYLDIERIDDFQASARAKVLIQAATVRREIQALRSSEFVEYERVYRLKQRFLKLLFRTFLKEWASDTPRARELAEYIHREGDLLHRFAVHSALDEAIHKEHPDIWHWRAWPEPYQDPESAATREFAEKNWRDVLFHKYVQWQLDLQLRSAQDHARQRGLSIGLYHDLALATDRFGCDLWAYRDFFVDGCRVGAPPDIFSPKGQDWSFPPPCSERHYEDGYRLFAESIRKNCRHGGALRIDHVMRFFHLFWIPDGMEATDGTYVRDRAEDLIAILALESVRQKVLVVGEDLGTVPDEIRGMLRRFGVLSYGLLYFEQDKEGRFLPPQEYPREALVAATTHDLPTIAGFWQGRDIEARRNAGLLPDEAAYHRMVEERIAEKQRLLDLLHQLQLLPDWFARNARDVPELAGEMHNAIVGLLASTPSKLMLLNQEDLLKETEQQNLPGSTEQYPNWRRKMKCTVEELWASPEVHAFTQMFRSWLERTGRLNSAG
ncbi:MAG TPA: 4-alpha-glucanotransferase [Bryobacteraceae bacterium]|nr:4-alpha-glucanotransferase [Bryobacteraceae bacterium]